MATPVGVLRAEMEAGQARFGRDLGKARKHGNKFNKDMIRGFKKTNRASSDMTASIKRAGAAILVIAGPAVIGAFVKASISAAGNAVEAWSKFEAVFKDQADATRAWANQFANDVGRSETEVGKWLSTLQDTFVPMGIARDEAAGLSKDLVALAVDLGSFNDTADTAVIEAFQSAMVGNHETVRKFGIVITEATLRQEAYDSGIAKVGTTLNNQQKILARYNLLIAGTEDAHGDAIETADSYNNQVKRMESEFQKLSETLGEIFLPTASDAVVAITDLVSVTDQILESDNKWGLGLKFLINLQKFSLSAAIALAKADAFNQNIVATAREKNSEAIIQSNKDRLEEIKIMKAEGLERGLTNKTINAEILELEILEAARIDEEAASLATKEALDAENESRQQQVDDLEEADLWMKIFSKTSSGYSHTVAPDMTAAMKDTDAAIKQYNQDLIDSTTVMINAGQVADIMGGFIGAAFGPAKESGAKFKEFVLGFLGLLEGVVLSSEAASIAVNSIFIPGAGPGLIIASLIALESAKAGVRAMEFAHGGSFVVGGQGGRDTSPVSFMATPGETVTIQTPEQRASGGRPGGGGGAMTLNQKIVFQGLTPAEFIDKTVIPRIEQATRSATTDLLGLKNVRRGSDLGGDLLRAGKGS